MALNLGSITYGSLSVLPGYDTASSGFGNLIVSGTSLLAGASTSVSGTLGVTGTANLKFYFDGSWGVDFQRRFDVQQSCDVCGRNRCIERHERDQCKHRVLLQVKGGLGVLLSTYLGSTLNVTGATTCGSTLAVTGGSTFTGAVAITNTTVSNSYTEGALTVAGGLGVSGNIRSGVGSLYLADNLIVRCDGSTGIAYLSSPANDLQINDTGVYDVFVNANSTASFNVSGAINVDTTGLQVLTNTDSTTVTNGAFTVAGGASVGLTLNVGGNISAPITQSVSVGSGIFTATTQSTSVTTGGIRTAGGLGVAKNVFVGGNLDVASTAAAYSSVGNFRMLSTSNGANWIQSGDIGRTASNWTPLKFSPLGSGTSILTINASDVSVDKTTASTSSSTGAFTVAGGVGIAGDIYVGASSTFAGVGNFQNDTWINGKSIYLGTYNDESDGLVFLPRRVRGVRSSLDWTAVHWGRPPVRLKRP